MTDTPTPAQQAAAGAAAEAVHTSVMQSAADGANADAAAIAAAFANEATTTTTTVAAPAAEATTTETTAAETTTETTTEQPEGVKLFDELDQASKDKVYGTVRRELRAQLEAKDARIAELETKEHNLLLDSLAVGGVKRERLERTGLKGDALKTFAQELAADIAEASGGAAQTTTAAAPAAAGSTTSLESALGAPGAVPNGVTFGVGKPATMDELMAQLNAEIAGGSN